MALIPPDIEADNWTWERWKREFDANQLDGWSFCRFATRAGPNAAKFVFGWVSHSFGIWEQPFKCCDSDRGDGEYVLACLTHLPSGLGFGIFQTRELAAICAEAAEYMCDWRGIDPDNTARWRFIHEEVGRLWRMHCIVPSPVAHAHLEDRTAVIWHHNPDAVPAEVKPEKLS